MSVTLADIGNNNENFTSSRWSWKVAMAIMEKLEVIDESTIQMLRKGHLDIVIDKAAARAIADAVRTNFIEKLNPKGRVFSNLTTTDEPDDGTLYRSPDEEWKNYSATREWLESFADFCESSDGFRIF